MDRCYPLKKCDKRTVTNSVKEFRRLRDKSLGTHLIGETNLNLFERKIRRIYTKIYYDCSIKLTNDERALTLFSIKIST